MAAIPNGAEVRISYPAGADLTGLQFYWMKLVSGEAVPCDAATDRPIGVLQDNDVVAGRMAELIHVGPTKLAAGGVVTAGDQIGTDANAQAATKVAGTDVTEYVAGTALDDASAADEIFSAVVNCATPHRAA